MREPRAAKESEATKKQTTITVDTLTQTANQTTHIDKPISTQMRNNNNNTSSNYNGANLKLLDEIRASGFAKPRATAAATATVARLATGSGRVPEGALSGVPACVQRSHAEFERARLVRQSVLRAVCGGKATRSTSSNDAAQRFALKPVATKETHAVVVGVVESAKRLCLKRIARGEFALKPTTTRVRNQCVVGGQSFDSFFDVHR